MFTILGFDLNEQKQVWTLFAGQELEPEGDLASEKVYLIAQSKIASNCIVSGLNISNLKDTDSLE